LACSYFHHHDDFVLFQHDRQTLIITSIFRCSHDEDIIVRSCAVRALATYILFPTLRKVMPHLFQHTINLLKLSSYLMHQHSEVVHAAHTLFICFVFISEQMVTLALYNINRCRDFQITNL